MRHLLEHRTRSLLLGATLLLAAAPGAHADWGLGARAGTLGIGVDLAHSFTPLFNVRVGINGYTYGFDFDTDNADYDADLKLESAHALVDFHPWAGGFRLTGGLLHNRNRIEASGTRSGGDKVNAEIDFDRSAPYIGIGWGNATRGFVPVSWSLDLGVVAQGSPRVDLSSPTLSGPQLQAEEDDLEHELSSFDTYPVISGGLIFRF